jgi:hypothetical protein
MSMHDRALSIPDGVNEINRDHRNLVAREGYSKPSYPQDNNQGASPSGQVMPWPEYWA